MKKSLMIICIVICLCFVINAQEPTPTPKAETTKKTKPPVFRANKAQVMEAQKMLKDKGLYGGEQTGKLDADTRAGIKKYQENEGLKQTGTLNRVTLEKMGIALTDKQKAIPAPPPEVEKPKKGDKTTETTSGEKTKRGPVFRANKDQIMLAQKTLKEKGHYSGEETGKLDDATREGLKKYQEANKIKVTGTLNKETLEKMGIVLTDKQKEN